MSNEENPSPTPVAEKQATEKQVVDEKQVVAEQNEMRAYLQRAEVRLGTMQRVAGLLLNGAGLMILLSMLAGNKIVEKTSDFLCKVDTNLTILYSILYSLFKEDISLNIHYLFLFIPVMICLWLPFRFLYVLLEELFKFYFAEKLSDKATDYNSSASNFVLPASVLPLVQTQTDRNTSGRHSLITEVAITESLLARHTVGLRRLLFKYVNALLVMLWTTLVLFMTVALFELMSLQAQALAIALWYIIWGIVTLLFVKHPFRWIERDTSGHPDIQLIKRFITEVEGYAVVAIVSEIFFILIDSYPIAG